MTDRSIDPLLDWRSYQIEQTGTGGGHCDCCGSTTKRVWGFAHNSGGIVAAYFVSWTKGVPDHGARFDLILGKWGDSATSDDRYSVALDFRVVEASPQFMVVDAEGRLPSDAAIAQGALKRSDVIGTPLASQVFALIDAIYAGDPRLNELRTWQHGVG